MFGSSLGDLALRRVWNHRIPRSRMSSTSLRSTPFSSMTYAELRSRFPSGSSFLKVLAEAGPVAFSGARFEFADEVPKEAQHGSLAHLPNIFSSHLHGLSKVAVTEFCTYVPPRLLSLLLCYVHLSLHTGPRATTVCSAWALRARYQFGRSGKHDIGHIGDDVTDAGAIGGCWKCVNHRVRNLASKVRVSHQPPKVGQLRSFRGSVPLPPVWCGPAWAADFRVHETVI